MPVKKRKTTKKVTKKKTPVTKSRSRAAAKKKPAKKKTPAKKKKPASHAKKKTKQSRSQKTAPGKKPAKTQAVRERKPSAHALAVHSKQQQVTRRIKDKESSSFSAKALLRGFSFQDALTQVRDTVHSNQHQFAEEQPTPARIETKEPKLVSPYVLDLKNRKTMVHSYKVASSSSKKLVQPRLSLFEEEPKSVRAALNGFAADFASTLKPKKRLNLLQTQRSSQGSIFRKSARRFAYRLSTVGAALSAPYRQWTDAKRQKTLRLNLSHTHPASVKKIPLLISKTRSGHSIPVSKISRTLQKAKGAVADASSLVPLSAMLHRQKSRSPLQIFEGVSLRRAFVPFAVLVMLLVLPFSGSALYQSLTRTQGEVLGAADKAVHTLQAATDQAKSFQFLQASANFKEASQTFMAASALIENQQGLVAKILVFIPWVGQRVEAGRDLLNVGTKLSEAANLLSQGVAVFADEKHFLADQPLSYKLEYLFVRLEEASPLLHEASQRLEDVDVSDLPENMQADIALLQKNLPVLDKQLASMQAISPSLLTFLGHENLERYLLVFQNNTELRASGGFMGSIALLDIDRADIKNIEIPGGGPYDYQGSFYQYYQSPRALRLINPRWELQDANWFFDWETSAKKISSFYEKAGGPSVDGVVAINTNVLQELLAFVGSVYLEEYDMQIDADNFRELLQNYVEFEYDTDLNQPKKIIADLAPLLLEEIKNLEPEQYLELSGKLSGLLEEKDIMIYHRDESIQQQFDQLGWTGHAVDTDRDYLAVVHTNLAGGKTDGVIDDTFDLTTQITEAGAIKHTLTIKRTHNGQKGIPLIGVRNVDYVRVYVPEGSTLVEAQGFEQPPQHLFEVPEEQWIQDEDLAGGDFVYQVHESSGTEIYQEGTKTVFANWIQVDPGQTEEVKLVYEVPRSVLASYTIPSKESSWIDWFTGDTAHIDEVVHAYQLIWQKQSGSWDPEMNITVNYPYDWQLQASSDVSGINTKGSWTSAAQMNTDSVWSFLFY